MKGVGYRFHGVGCRVQGLDKSGAKDCVLGKLFRFSHFEPCLTFNVTQMNESCHTMNES